MKTSGGLVDQGVVVGNPFDKYGSRNVIVRRLMHGFHSTLFEFVERARPTSIHEVGCGEGVLTIALHQRGIPTRGSDFSDAVLDMARSNAAERGVPTSLFEARSIYDLDPSRDSADLIVCCEVMEHLDEPERALQSLQRVTERHLIVSVPREPIWRVLNVARGKYLTSLGNSMGHVQHWSTNGIKELVSRYFEVVDVRTPLPWTFLLCRARR